MTGTQVFQREYFALLDDVFTRLTGEKYSAYATIDGFDANVRPKGHTVALHFGRNYPQVLEELRAFYSKHRLEPFRQAKDIEGLKFVLGGSGRFLASHYNSVRRMLLYADTILLPDPVLPWIEAPREEEEFYLIWLLRSIHTLLYLKPLVDADLPSPAIYVFPSWEKSLERQDQVTREGISNLSLGIFNLALKHSFSRIEDVAEYARTQPSRFLTKIEHARAFIAPGGSAGEPLKDALSKYKSDIRTWRSESFQAQLKPLSDAQLVFIGVLERIAPQFHLLENSRELGANPLTALPVHWHYYNLVTRSLANRLVVDKVITRSSVKIMHGLNQPSLHWLGRVPMDVLVRMRQERENEDFRMKLHSYVSELHDASLEDLDVTSREVTRGIKSLLARHQKELSKIVEKHHEKHMQTAAGAWISLAGMFVPALAPFLGTAAPLALIGKYAVDKLQEKREIKAISHSLMGVLAEANQEV
jgi:hypothetical protein